MRRLNRAALERAALAALTGLLVLAAALLASTGRAGGAALALLFLGVAALLHRLVALEGRLARTQDLLAALVLDERGVQNRSDEVEAPS